MRLIIVSGRSGSGKSTALNVLEDNGFCLTERYNSIEFGQLREQLSRVRVGLLSHP